MRTKTLLLAAALTAAGIASYAQSNVYSINVVGYVNVTVPANGFALIANPLNATNNTIGSLLPNVPAGTTLYKYSGGYSAYTMDDFDLTWTPDASATLNPGEGAFVKNVTGTTMTLTFVGEVLQGAQSNPLPAGYSIRSSKVPQTADVNTLELPAEAGDTLYKYSGGYSAFTLDDFDLTWTPSVPIINVGEAFFLKEVSGKTWNRTFNVP